MGLAEVMHHTTEEEEELRFLRWVAAVWDAIPEPTPAELAKVFKAPCRFKKALANEHA